jgi:hypothetical protein
MEDRMNQVVLRRTLSAKDGTFGLISFDKLKWYTVERPWVDNKNNESCIPIGSYVCKWTLSPRLKKYAYEVLGVPKRAGIRIHSANFAHQVLGCIALGKTLTIIDGQRGVFSSVTAIREFNEALNKQDFQLEVK